MRETNRLTISDVFDRTGISRAQISRIENGLVDPRMSTVTQLLSCYGATLGDVESIVTTRIALDEIKLRAELSAEKLNRLGMGASDPIARLARKDALGVDTNDEREALDSRR